MAISNAIELQENKSADLKITTLCNRASVDFKDLVADDIVKLFYVDKVHRILSLKYFANAGSNADLEIKIILMRRSDDKIIRDLSLLKFNPILTTGGTAGTLYTPYGVDAGPKIPTSYSDKTFAELAEKTSSTTSLFRDAGPDGGSMTLALEVKTATTASLRIVFEGVFG
jgi:hypothetical protein